MIDVQSLVKYLLEGVAVAVAAYYIPKRSSNLRDIALIALTAAAVFAVLDIFTPGVSVGARQGAGFGIGSQITGGAEGFSDDAAPAPCDTDSDSDSDSDSDEAGDDVQPYSDNAVSYSSV